MKFQTERFDRRRHQVAAFSSGRPGLAFQLACFGLATGAVAIAFAASTGRKSLATGMTAAVAVLGWLINSFAPLVTGLGWLKYLSLFYYYASHDPLGRGVGLPGLIVLGVLSVVMLGAGLLGLAGRDLRG